MDHEKGSHPDVECSVEDAEAHGYVQCLTKWPAAGSTGPTTVDAEEEEEEMDAGEETAGKGGGGGRSRPFGAALCTRDVIHALHAHALVRRWWRWPV